SGNLWLGTANGGLNRFDRETETFTRYQHDPTNPNSPGSDIVQEIYRDESGTLWLGTYGGGLNRFDPETETFRVFTEQNSEICNNVIYGILEDEHGNLWLSTNAGICKFNPKSNTFHTYDVDDGLQSREFNGQAYFKSQSGEMFFGGIQGFNAFYPDSVKHNPFVPQIALTDFKLFSESVPIGGNSPLKKHISETTEIRLAYWQNDISFEFVALHFSRPENNRYAYMLENYDEEWRAAGTQRTATYTNLDPGEYVFQVKGSNNDGVWNEKGTSIKVIITSPFWETWWFRGLAALFMVGLAFTFYRRRLKNVRMKAELRAAHDAQMAIMPQSDPQIEGFDISGICIPANEVGGDFFDYMWLNEERTKFGIAVGDVSGKAMKSAMTAVMTDGMICMEADEIKSIKEIMDKVNRSIYRKTDKKEFTALCLASLDIQTKELTFTNAGLNEPLLGSNGSVAYLKSKGSKFPLGSIQDADYEETRTQLASGSVLVLFTDGIPEARNHAGEFYGEPRLKSLLEQMDTLNLPAKAIKNKIIGDVKRFVGIAHQHDDMTLIVVKTT
ncbi:MAG: SpoIIE family protein phosphatase, partial [bacterium]